MNQRKTVVATIGLTGEKPIVKFFVSEKPFTGTIAEWMEKVRSKSKDVLTKLQYNIGSEEQPCYVSDEAVVEIHILMQKAVCSVPELLILGKDGKISKA